MAFITARLLEILQMGEGVAGIFDLSKSSLPSPGQFVPAQRLTDEAQVLTEPLFRVIGVNERPALGPIPDRWGPGDRIVCLPPQGSGFALPTTARRVGLLSLDGDPIRILPLVQPALAQGAAVALFFQDKPYTRILDAVPASVEINPLSGLEENLSWPDFLAVEVDHGKLKNLLSLLGTNGPGVEGQVLIRTPMPCHGIGACGACAVKTRQGWRQVCTEGPVFPLEELLHVAG